MCTTSELHEIYSWPKFVRTYAIVRARDWVIPMHGLEEVYVMVPLIDMLNYGQVQSHSQSSDAILPSRNRAYVVWPLLVRRLGYASGLTRQGKRLLLTPLRA